MQGSEQVAVSGPPGGASGPSVTTQLSPATADTGQRVVGFGLMLTSSASMPIGGALGAMAFPAIGPVGVVAVRQFVTALVLVCAVRPRLGGLQRAQWLPILGLTAVFSVMNISLYVAIDRIGLGMAITLEFLGPLTVAIASSRRAVDIGCAILAGVGVVVLTNPGPSTDVIGIGLALVAATAWGAYIVFNRMLGQRLPGLDGTTIACLLAGLLWLPIGIGWFLTHPPTLVAIGLALACGLLSSIVPFVADLLALRRVPTGVFGILTSLSPVWAVLSGWVLLNQVLDVHEGIGIALIIVSSALVSARALRHPHHRQPAMSTTR